MTSSDWIQIVISLLTAVGVGIAAWQLFDTKRQALSQFEDSLVSHYRGIASRIPLKALLGQQLSEDDLEEHLRVFYEYFDLTNEQAFLAKRGRIRKTTWRNWREGIEQHLERPAFQQAWVRLSPHLDGSFDEFKALLPERLRLRHHAIERPITASTVNATEITYAHEPRGTTAAENGPSSRPGSAHVSSGQAQR